MEKENPRRYETMKCDIVRDHYTSGCCYVVSAGEIALDVTVITWHHQADLNRWLRRVRWLYGQKDNKKCKIVVGINARKSINCVGGSRGARKGKVMHHELLQICIGQHCLIIEIEPYGAVRRSLKAFFKVFFQDDRFMFVGLGIKDIAGQLYRDYKYTDYDNMAIIPKPVDLKELAAYAGEELKDLVRRKCSLEMLVQHVLGVDYEKPKTLAWYGEGYEFSEELIMWSSVDVYLMTMIGSILSN
ncbi:unnamed protein product [Rhodiola kirilowii]